MRDNEIITGIRETRHAFAAKYGNDLRKIAEAAGFACLNVTTPERFMEDQENE